MKIISADSSNEDAAILLSEVLFMSSEIDFNAAVKPLQLLLKDYPNNYKGENWECVGVCVLTCYLLSDKALFQYFIVILGQKKYFLS